MKQQKAARGLTDVKSHDVMQIAKILKLVLLLAVLFSSWTMEPLSIADKTPNFAII